jgi:sugar phosphate isomerase/epimerase
VRDSQAWTRREFGRVALAGLPFAALTASIGAQTPRRRPNSVVEGVQIGVISSSFVGLAASEIIPAMLKLGLSEIELQPNHAEALAGAPLPGPTAGAASVTPQTLNADGLLPRCAGRPMVITPPLSSANGARGGRGTPTPEQQAAQERLRAWRTATTPATWKAVRRQFDEAGIDLRILWYSLGFQGAETSDEDIDYAFRMAQGLGVKAMSGSSTIPIAVRIARAAEKYKILWGGHTQDNVNDPDQFVSPETYEKLLSMSRYFRVNLDVGYFTAAGFDPVAFIAKYHDRITDIHLKDKKPARLLGGDVTDSNLNNFPWGQGETPIREVLQLLKKNKHGIPVQIEYEYGCRTTADAVTEVGRCYAYARQCLERT